MKNCVHVGTAVGCSARKVVPTVIFKEPPCKDCAERRLNCHSQCSKWLDWKEAENRKNAEIVKAMNVERVFQEVQVEKSVRFCRRMHNQKTWL